MNNFMCTLQKRWIREDFPTPPSPTTTTLKMRISYFVKKYINLDIQDLSEIETLIFYLHDAFKVIFHGCWELLDENHLVVCSMISAKPWRFSWLELPLTGDDNIDNYNNKNNTLHSNDKLHLLSYRPYSIYSIVCWRKAQW